MCVSLIASAGQSSSLVVGAVELEGGLFAPLLAGFHHLCVGVVAARIISKNIADPLEESVGLLNAVADGDLTQELPVELADRRDEVGEMVASLEKMQGALRAFLKDVHEEAERSVAMVHEVQELVGALNDGAQDMSAVTEEMAAGMEETAASTSNLENLSDQISASVKSNATSRGTACRSTANWRGSGWNARPPRATGARTRC